LPLHHFQRRALERFCREHGLDTELIDDSLSYEENLKALKRLVPKEVEELAELYAKTYEDWEKAVSLGDLYGIPSEALEVEQPNIPLLIVKCWIQFSYRVFSNVRIYLSKFPQHTELYGRKYALIQGDYDTVLEILNYLLRNFVRFKILRVSTRKPKDWQYIPKHGWVKVLEEYA